MTIFETKLIGDEPYSLVWLHIGGREYHRPTLQEMKEIVQIREAQRKRQLVPDDFDLVSLD